MGVCVTKQGKKPSNLSQNNPQILHKDQIPNTTQINTPYTENENKIDLNIEEMNQGEEQLQMEQIDKEQQQKQQQKQDEQIQLKDEQQNINKDIDIPMNENQIPIPPAQNDNSEEEEEEEEKRNVKQKQTIVSLDQQSTYFTAHLNELTSKKDYQTSETSTNNPMRQKKPTKINTYNSGLIVQVFEPTQNSMEEAFSINEMDEEMEDEDEQQQNKEQKKSDQQQQQQQEELENLSDENEENIAQKNKQFQKIVEDPNAFKLLNLVAERNPNDVASNLSNNLSYLDHSDVQNEHND